MKILKRYKKKKFTSVKIKGDTVWLTVLSQEKSFQKSGAMGREKEVNIFFSTMTSNKSNICLKKKVSGNMLNLF